MLKPILNCALTLVMGSALTIPSVNPVKAGEPLTEVQLLKGYGLNQIPLNGEGQTIAVLVPGAIDPAQIRADLAQSTANVNRQAAAQGFIPLAPAQLQIQFVDPSGNQPGAINREGALDTQMVHLVAPNAKLKMIIFNDAPGALINALRIAINDGVNVISISAGKPEAKYQPTMLMTINQLLASHPEITFVAASGDSGDNPDAAGNAQVAFPASSPFVVAVGAVNEDFSLHPEAWANSGGGQSRIFPQLGVQNKLGIPGNRLLPDVAMAGGNGNRIYFVSNGASVVDSGTSFASPLFAAIVGLANQQNGEPLGFISQSLYQPYTHNYSAHYRHSGGYNTRVGLGVPQVQAMIDHLTHAPGECVVADNAGRALQDQSLVHGACVRLCRASFGASCTWAGQTLKVR